MITLYYDSFRITDTSSGGILPGYTTHRALIDFIAINYFTEIQCVVIFLRIERCILLSVVLGFYVRKTKYNQITMTKIQNSKQLAFDHI